MNYFIQYLQPVIKLIECLSFCIFAGGKKKKKTELSVLQESILIDKMYKKLPTP